MLFYLVLLQHLPLQQQPRQLLPKPSSLPTIVKSSTLLTQATSSSRHTRRHYSGGQVWQHPFLPLHEHPPPANKPFLFKPITANTPNLPFSPLKTPSSILSSISLINKIILKLHYFTLSCYSIIIENNALCYLLTYYYSLFQNTCSSYYWAVCSVKWNFIGLVQRFTVKEICFFLRIIVIRIIGG